MNTEWIYLGLIALMLVFCCYPMMRMMMRGSDKEEHPKDRQQPAATRADAETAGTQKVLKR